MYHCCCCGLHLYSNHTHTCTHAKCEKKLPSFPKDFILAERNNFIPSVCMVLSLFFCPTGSSLHLVAGQPKEGWGGGRQSQLQYSGRVLNVTKTCVKVSGV